MVDIIFVIASPTPTGGMEEAMLRLATLVENGHAEIWVTGPRRANRAAWEARAEAVAPGVGIRFVPCPQLRLLLAPRGQTLVVVGLWSAIWLGFAPRIRRFAVVYWEHSVTAERLTSSARFSTLAKLAAIVYRRARAVVSVSSVVEEGLLRLGVESRVIPNPPSHAMRFPANRCVSRKTLACVGSLKQVKRVDLAIEALTCLPEHRLLIAGAGPEAAKLKALGKTLGVAERIVWLGHVEDPRLVYVEASTIIHLSESETYGYVLYEAAAHGIPVVVRDFPSLTSSVPEAVPGVVVGKRPTKGDIAAAIRSLDDGGSVFEPIGNLVDDASLLEQWSTVVYLSRGIT